MPLKYCTWQQKFREFREWQRLVSSLILGIFIGTKLRWHRASVVLKRWDKFVLVDVRVSRLFPLQKGDLSPSLATKGPCNWWSNICILLIRLFWMKRDDNAILQDYFHIAASIWQVIQVLDPSVGKIASWNGLIACLCPSLPSCVLGRVEIIEILPSSLKMFGESLAKVLS